MEPAKDFVICFSILEGSKCIPLMDGNKKLNVEIKQKVVDWLTLNKFFEVSDYGFFLSSLLKTHKEGDLQHFLTEYQRWNGELSLDAGPFDCGLSWTIPTEDVNRAIDSLPADVMPFWTDDAKFKAKRWLAGKLAKKNFLDSFEIGLYMGKLIENHRDAEYRYGYLMSHCATIQDVVLWFGEA